MSKKTIVRLCYLIIVISLIVSLAGIISQDGSEIHSVENVYGETIDLYGKGIYKMNSVSVAAQGIASDWATALIAVPILFMAIRSYKKGSVRGELMLTGILGYFLYTYMSYVFLWFYNPFFLLYIGLMSLSLFTLCGLVLSSELRTCMDHIDTGKNVVFISLIQLLVSFLIGGMWLGILLPSLWTKEPPMVLEHYTTLVIQAMDLGLVIPLGLISGIQLLRRQKAGYFMTPIILIKGFMMLLAILVMIVNMKMNGTDVSLIQVLIIVSALLMFAFAGYSFYGQVIRKEQKA